MAKRMKSKIQPAVMKLNFLVTATTDGKQSSFIDLSQAASLVNRRFYRQGLNWAVSGIKLLTGAGIQGSVSIHKLPNTWVMSNAWEKSFRVWQRMIKNATEESGSQSIKGKFLDYKVYANGDHQKAGVGKNILPHSAATLGASIQVATPGQWDMSVIEVPSIGGSATTVEYDIVAVGPNVNVAGASGNEAKSIIVGYANSRALPSITDPNVPMDMNDGDENWFSSLFTDGSQQDREVLQDLEHMGDEPPYPFENGTNPAGGTFSDTMYPGGETQLNSLEIHAQEYVTGTTVGGTTYFPGGNFPCGLIEISTFEFKVDDPLVFEFTLVPGNHRGYLAEPMTEM